MNLNTRKLIKKYKSKRGFENSHFYNVLLDEIIKDLEDINNMFHLVNKLDEHYF